MFEDVYRQLDGALQHQLLDVVANPVFLNMAKLHVEDTKRQILELDAEGETPEDFRLQYAIAQASHEKAVELVQFLEATLNDLQDRMNME